MSGHGPRFNAGGRGRESVLESRVDTPSGRFAGMFGPSVGMGGGAGLAANGKVMDDAGTAAKEGPV